MLFTSLSFAIFLPLVFCCRLCSDIKGIDVEGA